MQLKERSKFESWTQVWSFWQLVKVNYFYLTHYYWFKALYMLIIRLLTVCKSSENSFIVKRYLQKVLLYLARGHSSSSMPWPHNSEAVGSSPGWVMKGIKCKTFAKSFIQACLLFPAEGSSWKNKNSDYLDSQKN